MITRAGTRPRQGPFRLSRGAGRVRLPARTRRGAKGVFVLLKGSLPGQAWCQGSEVTPFSEILGQAGGQAAS